MDDRSAVAATYVELGENLLGSGAQRVIEGRGVREGR